MKVNFNVPLIDIDGTPVEEAKIDYKNLTPNKEGVAAPKVVTDEEGKVIYEPVTLKTIVINILLRGYEGDDKLPGSERLARGKLADKVSRKNNVNYSTKELELIQTLAARSASTLQLQRLDQLINGDDEQGEAEPGQVAGEEAAA